MTNKAELGTPFGALFPVPSPGTRVQDSVAKLLQHTALTEAATAPTLAPKGKSTVFKAKDIAHPSRDLGSKLVLRVFFQPDHRPWN